MSALSKHVIHQPRPLRKWITLAVASSVIAVLVWLYIAKATEQLRHDVLSLQQQNEQLVSAKAELNHSAQWLTEQRVEQEQHLAVQNEMSRELQEQVSYLQKEVVDLNRELAFYHNITQGNVSSELQVRELELLADKLDKRRIHYRLVLTQGKKITKPISGTVSLQLNAHQGENKIELPIAEHAFKLRHVQVLTGHIQLPADAKPNTVTVTYKQNKKKSRSQHFDWQLAAS